MPAPYEMVSGPLTVYYASVGTPAPELSATPPATWTLLGTNGDKSITEDGLSIEFDETVEDQMVLGSTAVQKQFRTEESVMFNLTLLDMTAETFAFAMSRPGQVTDVPPSSGVAGRREVPLLKGFTINYSAFLMRGFSPYISDLYRAQFWVPNAYAKFSGTVQYVKGAAAGIQLQITALEYQTEGYGKYMAQDASPL